MLSRRDIEKELGKGLAIYPLNEENIKENSINVTLSRYCWCQKALDVHWYGGSQFSINNSGNVKKTKHFDKGQLSVFVERQSGKAFVLLFPHSTTIIETEEVIGIGNYIGGAVHSKVGVVVQGVGDTGTMLGPGYCGHLLISLHNITDDIVALPVGSTFVSLTFDYLTTQVNRTSQTVSGHYDRLLEYKCKLTEEDKSFFIADWKGNFQSISDKMQSEATYKQYKKKLNANRIKEIRKYINKRNFFAVGIVAIAVIFLIFITHWLDTKNGNTRWADRLWNVGFSGVLGTCLIGLFQFVRGKK